MRMSFTLFVRATPVRGGDGRDMHVSDSVLARVSPGMGLFEEDRRPFMCR
jgi:hypothetical protein